MEYERISVKAEQMGVCLVCVAYGFPSRPWLKW